MANLKLIRELVKSRSMTIRDLAQRIGRDESSIQSAIRRGSTNSATIELIAKELGVSPSIFFCEGTGTDAEILQKEISYLKQILKEKERTIEILLSEKGQNCRHNVGTKK